MDTQSHVGKTILVGLTYWNQQDEVTRQEQFSGEVIGIDAPRNTIIVEATDGEEWHLPLWIAPDPPRGEYECSSTGDKVQDPDLITSLSVIESSDPDSPPTWAANTPLYDQMIPAEFHLTYRHDPAFIESLIESRTPEYIGKLVMVGINHSRREGEQEILEERRQVHGTIIRMSLAEGIVLELDDGTEFMMPPDPSMLMPAVPGEYREHSTGKTVVNPDLITIWAHIKSAQE